MGIGKYKVMPSKHLQRKVQTHEQFSNNSRAEIVVQCYTMLRAYKDCSQVEQKEDSEGTRVFGN